MSVSGFWMLGPMEGARLRRYLGAKVLSQQTGQPLKAVRRHLAADIIRHQPFFAPQPGRSLL